MNNSNNISNSVYLNNIREYKQCLGRNCTNVGKHPLKIIFIKKIGWFCDTCKQDLIKLGLVEKEEERSR